MKLAGEGDLTPSYGECVGVVKAAERAELMAGAIALMCPTIYVEPFAQVHVEAQLCGAPVVSTDWGVYTETVEQGVSGYRCRTLGEFMWAAQELASWDVMRRLEIQDRARERWSCRFVRAVFVVVVCAFTLRIGWDTWQQLVG